MLKRSSAAGALAAGGQKSERVERRGQMIAKKKGKSNTEIDKIVALVDGWLEKNRKKAA